MSVPSDPTQVNAIMRSLEADLERFTTASLSVRSRIATALREAIENGIYHGNLEVSSRMREVDEEAYHRIARQRSRQEPYRNRRLHILAEITPELVRYVIQDEGPGFNPETVADPTTPENVTKASGRGLLLIRTFMDSATHDKGGTEITLTKRLS